MSVTRSGTKAHDDAIAAAEGVRQVACAPGASASTIKTAEIAFYRTVVSSCRANNNSSGIEQALVALHELGVQQ
jgi:hypothetical protein